MLKKALLIRKFARRKAGSTAIEAVLCLPIVVIFFMGTFQYALFMYGSFNLTRLMDAGARDIAMMDDPQPAEILLHLQSRLPAKDAQQTILHVEKVEKSGKAFAEIRMIYSGTIDLGFVPKIPVRYSYRNFVVIYSELDYV